MYEQSTEIYEPFKFHHRFKVAIVQCEKIKQREIKLREIKAREIKEQEDGEKVHDESWKHNP